MREDDTPRLIILLRDTIELDYASSIAAMGGSEYVYEVIVKQTIHSIPSHVEQMEKCLEANNDLLSFSLSAHSLKSSLRQIGNPRLARSAEALEKAAKSEDRLYCREHFGEFRNEIMGFHEQTDACLRQIAAEADARKILYEGGICDFTDSITRARSAAKDFEAILAAEYIIPLKKYRFGEDIDGLISKTVDALEEFDLQSADNYIATLLDKCER